MGGILQAWNLSETLFVLPSPSLNSNMALALSPDGPTDFYEGRLRMSLGGCSNFMVD
jgi:hypothetical protein